MFYWRLFNYVDRYGRAVICTALYTCATFPRMMPRKWISLSIRERSNVTAGHRHRPVVALEVRRYVEPLIHLRLALVQLVLQTPSRNAAKRSLARHLLKLPMLAAFEINPRLPRIVPGYDIWNVLTFFLKNCRDYGVSRKDNV